MRKLLFIGLWLTALAAEAGCVSAKATEMPGEGEAVFIDACLIQDLFAVFALGRKIGDLVQETKLICQKAYDT